eukprot:4152273-Prymnesium_polylepis.1
MSDAVDGRSAARCRNTIVRQNVTFPQISLTLACGTSRAPPPGSGFRSIEGSSGSPAPTRHHKATPTSTL